MVKLFGCIDTVGEETGIAGNSSLLSEEHQAISQIADSKKSAFRALFYIGWVVQDDSLRSPFGPSPRAAPLFRCAQLKPAAGSNL